MPDYYNNNIIYGTLNVAGIASCTSSNVYFVNSYDELKKENLLLKKKLEKLQREYDECLFK